MDVRTVFGSIADYAKGGVEITGREEPSRYLFSNMFEVAANAKPWERIVVAKNLEFTIEVARAEGKSPWYACAHDETVLSMEGTMAVHFIKPADTGVVPPEDKEGAVRLAGELSPVAADSSESMQLRDVLVPALLSARTYVEVGRVAQPEVGLSLTAAVDAASGLAEDDRRYALLLSRLRVLREDTARVAKSVSLR